MAAVGPVDGVGLAFIDSPQIEPELTRGIPGGERDEVAVRRDRGDTRVERFEVEDRARRRRNRRRARRGSSRSPYEEQHAENYSRYGRDSGSDPRQPGPAGRGHRFDGLNDLRILTVREDDPCIADGLQTLLGFLRRQRPISFLM